MSLVLCGGFPRRETGFVVNSNAAVVCEIALQWSARTAPENDRCLNAS